MIESLGPLYNWLQPFTIHYLTGHSRLLTTLLLQLNWTELNCQRQSQSSFTTGGLPPISSSWRQAPGDSRPVIFIFQLNICGYSSCVTSSLTRGWVCRSQLLLILASAVILRFEPRDSWSHFTVSDSRLPQPGGPGPRIYIPQEQGGSFIPPGTLLLFIASYDSPGYGGGIRPRLHTGLNCQLLLVSRYVASGLTTAQTRRPLPSSECPLLLRIHWNVFT
jgi:hypothetical protein